MHEIATLDYTRPLRLRRMSLLGNRQLSDWTIFSRGTTRLASHISLPCPRRDSLKIWKLVLQVEQWQ